MASPLYPTEDLVIVFEDLAQGDDALIRSIEDNIEKVEKSLCRLLVFVRHQCLIVMYAHW